MPAPETTADAVMVAEDWLAIGRRYLAANAAESGADVLILGLCDEVARLRGQASRVAELLARGRYAEAAACPPA